MRQCRVLAALAALSLVLSGSAAAQVHRAGMLPDRLEYRVLDESGVATIPFDLVNNHIIIPVSVNGSEPFRTVLDTGMPMKGMALFSSDRTRALDLDYDDGIQAQVGGAGGSGEHFSAQIATGATLTLPGLEMTEARMIVLPPIPHFGTYHDGIIGAALFRNFVVEIDQDDGVLRLHDPDTYRPPEGAAALPLELKHGVPFITATVTTLSGTTMALNLVVDLGASHPVSLNTDSVEALSVPEGAIETTIGRGLSGDVKGHVGRIASLELGGQRLEDVVAMFPIGEHQSPGGMDSRNGNLGSGVMRRFNVTFDYAHDRMLLQPNRRFGDPFEHDMSGLLLREDGDRGVWIEAILPGSPAERAGLRPDDVIVSVDGQDASALGSHAIRDMLREDGAKVRFGYRRGDEEREVAVTLRRLV